MSVQGGGRVWAPDRHGLPNHTPYRHASHTCAASLVHRLSLNPAFPSYCGRQLCAVAQRRRLFVLSQLPVHGPHSSGQGESEQGAQSSGSDRNASSSDAWGGSGWQQIYGSLSPGSGRRGEGPSVDQPCSSDDGSGAPQARPTRAAGASGAGSPSFKWPVPEADSGILNVLIDDLSTGAFAVRWRGPHSERGVGWGRRGVGSTKRGGGEGGQCAAPRTAL